MDDFLKINNGVALPRADLPRVSFPRFFRLLSDLVRCNGYLVQFFVHPEGERNLLIAVARTSNLLVLTTEVEREFPSLTLAGGAKFNLFEREIAEQYGLRPAGHPWLKTVRYHANRTGRPDVFGNDYRADIPGNTPFYRVEGESVHEVAVGPVHAGVIEPGHFRFQCAGEEVLHLEIALGYQHRGIEDALPGGPHPASMSQMEALAGDTSIAHATAYASVMEALGGVEAPLRAQWLRAVALELERLANHTGDMGALALDVAFLPTSAACGKIRGDFLNLTALMCGNRFGRGLVRPGGCRHDLEEKRLLALVGRLKTHMADVEQAVAWFWDAASVRVRFRNVGVVHPSQAADIGLVGPAARACGLVRDVRFDHPAGWHRFSQAPVAVWPSGDIFARARVRSLEIQRSGRYLFEQLDAPVNGEIQARLPAPQPESLSVALVEGWRGEVCHVAVTDHFGRFRRYKITDPSFHNWTGLALALRGTAVSDFPICNKSFNLSYCGFDL